MHNISQYLEGTLRILGSTIRLKEFHVWMNFKFWEESIKYKQIENNYDGSTIKIKYAQIL